MSGRKVTPTLAAVQVTRRGPIPDEMVTYAEEKIEKVYRYTAEPVLSAHVVLTLAQDPANERPASAEVSLDFDGTNIRAHDESATMYAAIDAVSERLQHAVVRDRDKFLTRRRRATHRAE